MRTKTVERRIPQTREDADDRFRVRYRDRACFDVLEVRITRLATGELQTYRFPSADLPDRDSIHFSTRVADDRLVVTWLGLDAPEVGMQHPSATAPSLATADQPPYCESLPPIVGPAPKALVLGTMPGRQSLAVQQYYANPGNIFWPIVFALSGSDVERDYNSRVSFLQKHGIAVWDVCHKAARAGSRDDAIRDETPNDLDAFLDAHPTIALVVFNGQEAERLHDRYFSRRTHLVYRTCLSTSPANRSYSLEQRRDDWHSVLRWSPGGSVG
jgi:TDG/mug DNA glycosylase family protein